VLEPVAFDIATTAVELTVGDTATPYDTATIMDDPASDDPDDVIVSISNFSERDPEIQTAQVAVHVAMVDGQPDPLTVSLINIQNSGCDTYGEPVDFSCTYNTVTQLYAPDQDLPFMNDRYSSRENEWVAQTTALAVSEVPNQPKLSASGFAINTIDRFAIDEAGNEVGAAATARFLAQKAMADFSLAIS
jgi:hypothetical protein